MVLFARLLHHHEHNEIKRETTVGVEEIITLKEIFQASGKTCRASNSHSTVTHLGMKGRAGGGLLLRPLSCN